MREKILFVDQYNKIGGGQSVLIDLVKSFMDLGFECHLIVPEGGYLESKLKNVTFNYLPPLSLANGRKSPVDIFKLILHYIKIYKIKKVTYGFSYIYVNGPRYFILFYILSFFVSSKYIYHVHLDFNKNIKRLLSKINAQRNTFRIVFTSDFIQSAFTAIQKIKDLSKIRVIEPSFADKYDHLNFRQSFNEQSDKLNIIVLGRIIPQKGFHLVIELAKVFNNANYYIVGSPEDDSVDYFERLKNQNLSNVHFLGNSNYVEHLIEKLKINIGIVPSDWDEPFGIVALELMMCSCLTLVRNKGGLKQIAKKTDAVLFDEFDDLLSQVQLISRRTHTENNALALRQYSQTKKLYNNDVFLRKIKNELIG